LENHQPVLSKTNPTFISFFFVDQLHGTMSLQRRVLVVQAAILNVQKHFTPDVGLSTKFIAIKVLLNLGLQIWYEQFINDNS
jgi:hypothetical protein